MYPCPNCTKLSTVSPCKYGPGYICENGHIFEKEPVPPLMSGLTLTAHDNADSPAQGSLSTLEGGGTAEHEPAPVPCV